MPLKSLLRTVEFCGFHIVYASPRGAVPSYETAPLIKLAYELGSLVWTTAGIFIAPGALLVARKPLGINASTIRNTREGIYEKPRVAANPN
jgi:hypothetical protein